MILGCLGFALSCYNLLTFVLFVLSDLIHSNLFINFTRFSFLVYSVLLFVDSFNLICVGYSLVFFIFSVLV